MDRYLLLVTRVDDNSSCAWWATERYDEIRFSPAFWADRFRQKDSAMCGLLPESEPKEDRIMLIESNGYRLWYLRAGYDCDSMPKIWTAQELMETHFDAWVVNRESGVSHVIVEDNMTACGLEILSHFEETHEPQMRVCGRCRRSRDWYVRGVIDN